MTALDFFLFVCAGLGAVGVAIVARIMAEDAKTFIPRFAERLIRRSSSRIHEDEASAFLEEWLAHLHERHELTGKLFHAATIYLWGAGRVCRLVGYSSRRPKSFRVFKRVLDVSIVLAGSPIVAVVCLVIACMIVASGGGSPFVSLTRIGRDGKSIRLWKLNTIVPNADKVLEAHLTKSRDALQEWNEFGKIRNDPRITRIGRFLRMSSMDELPQLWSVVIGDLSLVGPRPYIPGQEPPDRGSKYYDLTPGLTGLWQISDRSGNTFAEREKADEEYHKRQSVLTDLKILVTTVLYVLRR